MVCVRLITRIRHVEGIYAGEMKKKILNTPQHTHTHIYTCMQTWSMNIPPLKVSELAYTNVNNRFFFCTANENPARIFPVHVPTYVYMYNNYYMYECTNKTQRFDIIFVRFRFGSHYYHEYHLYIYICILYITEPFWRNADGRIIRNRVKGQI